jgi:hypothetical protein
MFLFQHGKEVKRMNIDTLEQPIEPGSAVAKGA